MNQSNNNNSNNNRPQGNQQPGNRPQNGPRKGFHGRGRPGQGNRQENRPEGQGSGQGGNQNNRRPQHGRNPHHQPHHHRPQHANQQQNSHPQKGGSDAVFLRYEQLQQEHNNARKKYFEMFGTPDNNLKKKLENTFNKTLEALDKYELSLQPWQREQLLKKIELYKFDLTYSENHELIKPEALKEKPCYGFYPGLSEALPHAPFEDPHFLPNQINRASFKDDTEESVGSIEDYKKLKGL